MDFGWGPKRVLIFVIKLLNKGIVLLMRHCLFTHQYTQKKDGILGMIHRKEGRRAAKKIEKADVQLRTLRPRNPASAVSNVILFHRQDAKVAKKGV